MPVPIRHVVRVLSLFCVRTWTRFTSIRPSGEAGSAGGGDVACTVERGGWSRKSTERACLITNRDELCTQHGTCNRYEGSVKR